MDKLRAMQAFVQIVDAGSLTGAARALRSSLPATVRLLASLESHLKLRLINRTTRRLALTDEGRAYLDRCRAILAEIDEAEVAVTNRRSEPSGMLTITAPVLFGQLHVAPATTRFVQRYPQVHCRLYFDDRIVNLLERSFDVGVRIGHLEDSSLVAQRVTTMRRVVAASPAWLRRHGVPKHPRELARANCLCYASPTGSPWTFRHNGREFTVAVGGNIEFNQAAATAAACAAGLGVGRFIAYQVADLVARKKLRIVLEEFEAPPLPLSVVYPHARLLPARTRVFVDWIRRELAASTQGLPGRA